MKSTTVLTTLAVGVVSVQCSCTSPQACRPEHPGCRRAHDEPVSHEIAFELSDIAHIHLLYQGKIIASLAVRDAIATCEYAYAKADDVYLADESEFRSMGDDLADLVYSLLSEDDLPVRTRIGFYSISIGGFDHEIEVYPVADSQEEVSYVWDYPALRPFPMGSALIDMRD